MTPDPAMVAALERVERAWLDSTPPAGHPLIHGIFQRLPYELGSTYLPAGEVERLRTALEGLVGEANHNATEHAVWWASGQMGPYQFSLVHLNRARAVLAAVPRGAETGLDLALRLVDEAIFDLPIGNDVTYSRGYSAGIAAARESFRAALEGAKP